MNKLTLTLGVAVYAVLGPAGQAADIYTPGEPARGNFKNFAVEFLDSHCLDCHDNETKKGNLSLEDLGPVDETNAATWKSCLLYTSPSPRDQRGSRMPSSA